MITQGTRSDGCEWAPPQPQLCHSRQSTIVRNVTIQKRYLDYLILALLVVIALVIRLGFLSLYGNLILHEDSGPYIDEAERLIEGRETTNGFPAAPLAPAIPPLPSRFFQ